MVHRDDLGAAHARMAQLERELADKEDEGREHEAELEAHRAEIAALQAEIERLKNPPPEPPAQRVEPRKGKRSRGALLLVSFAVTFFAAAGAGMYLLMYRVVEPPRPARSAKPKTVHEERPERPVPVEPIRRIAVPPPRPSVRNGPRRITGQEIGALQRRHKRALKACYERALARDRSLTEVRATIQIEVAPSGKLSSVKVSGVGDVSLRSCLRRSIARWALEPLGGRAQKVEFPLIFRGS